ncbi:MAG: PAS domain-containing sensor histidine kinase [Planctomycetes bacterium]|nr:PAS domain-containing sensor histidine kinase [Planctomycetota bacterium]
MIRIADLFVKEHCTEQPDCDLVVSWDTPVHEVLAKMQESDSDAVAVEGSDERFSVISRHELVGLVLAELTQTQEHIAMIEKEASEVICDEVELVRECTVCGGGLPKSKLETAVDYMTEGLLILDAGGGLETGNPAAKQMLGLKPDDTLEDLLKVMDDFGLRQLIADSRSISEGIWGQFQIKSPEGKILQIRWVKMEAATGGQVGSLAIIRDVTDELAGEKAKVEFIAAITHELRTPLTIIQNSVSNILAGVTGKIGKKTREYLHTIGGDCKRFGLLISDLLDISKLESGNMPLNIEIVSVLDIAAEAVRCFSGKAVEKGLEIVSDLEAGIGPVYADRERILQVLFNLMENAIKFTDSGGKITLRVTDDAENIIVSVIDSGIGISDVQQRHVFDKFHQIGRQAGAGYKGTGLGLAIANGIIKMHGGRIWVDSAACEGSTFSFSLPKTDPSIILNKHLETMAKQASSRGGEFGLIFLQFETGDVGSIHGDEVTGRLIREIAAAADGLNFSDGDMALQMSFSELFFVINGAQKQRIDAMVRKIKKIVKNKLKNKFIEAGIVPICGLGVYPDHSCEIIELENLARQTAKRIE